MKNEIFIISFYILMIFLDILGILWYISVLWNIVQDIEYHYMINWTDSAREDLGEFWAIGEYILNY